MVARVDFYILQDQNPPERFACAISAKIFRQGLKIHLHTESRESAVALDDLLWTYRDISFLPHRLCDNRDDDDTPVTIGWPGGATANHDSVLINLNAKIPDSAGDFARIIEIVAAYEPLRGQARERYRQYRDMGYEMHNHEIDKQYADA